MVLIKIVLYGFLYLILTGFLIFFLFIDDKYINNKLEKIKEKFLKIISLKFNIKKESTFKRIKNIYDWIQTIIIALLLVFVIQYFYIGNYTVPTSSMYPTIKPGERFFADKVSYKFRQPERGEIIVFKEPLVDKERYTKRLIGLPSEYIEIKDNSVYINDKRYENNIDYYNSNTLQGENIWKVPQKGDSLKLIDGVFQVKRSLFSLKTLREKIKEDSAILDEIYIISAKFVLNDNINTGPIYDRDILLKLINGKEIILENDYYFVLGDNSSNSQDSRYWGFVSENRIIGKMLFRFWPLNNIGIVH